MSRPSVAGVHCLSVAGLSLSRGPRQLFRDLAWKLESGNALIFRGANGSGKTTLLRVLAGLTASDSGSVNWDDLQWTPLCAGQRAATLYLGHINALKDELTAAENLTEALSFDGLVVTDSAQRAALDRVGLSGRHDLLARRLSQGQKRRIGLARLSLSEKPLWLLDEPTNALDAEGAALFSGLVDEHLNRGGMACIATHLPLALAGRTKELTMGSTIA